MLLSGIKWLRLQTKMSISVFALKSLVINSSMLFYVIKTQLLAFDIEMQQVLLYVITLVVRFLSGIVTDVGLVVGVYFGMKSLLIISVVWKTTAATFDLVLGSSYIPTVYQQTYDFVQNNFDPHFLNSTFAMEATFCTIYVLMSLLMVKYAGVSTRREMARRRAPGVLTLREMARRRAPGVLTLREMAQRRALSVPLAPGGRAEVVFREIETSNNRRPCLFSAACAPALFLQAYGSFRIHVYYRCLYYEEGRMTTVDVAASLVTRVSST